jgi:type I restriction enzyme M protein
MLGIRESPAEYGITNNGSRRVWIETLDDLRARNYDLSARNPNANEREVLPPPADLTARLLERQRELQASLERLHAVVSNGEEE